MKRVILLSFLLFVLLCLPVIGHGDEKEETSEVSLKDGAVGPFVSPWLILQWTFVFGGLLLFYAVAKKKHSDLGKKVVFWSFTLIITAATLYLVSYSVYLNVVSDTGGPVHWHADFEIWICGEKQFLPESRFPSNKVGTPLFHHHDDYRIHIEGIVVNLEDIELEDFFVVIGGHLANDRIGLPQEDGSVEYWQNGDTCPDGSEGVLSAKVQHGYEETWEPLDDFAHYLIAPYTDVPPGDRIELRFE